MVVMGGVLCLPGSLAPCLMLIGVNAQRISEDVMLSLNPLFQIFSGIPVCTHVLACEYYGLSCVITALRPLPTLVLVTCYDVGYPSREGDILKLSD